MIPSSSIPARINFVIGSGGIILAVVAALALGITFEKHGTQQDLYLFTTARFFLRFSHTHGMPLSLYNLIVGLALVRLPLSLREARIAAWGAASTWVVPLVMTLKGAAGAPPDFPHVEIVGIVGMVASAIVLLRGGLRITKSAPSER